jgi:alpha-tubulin suppressor-like RCC1 family protein
MSNPITNFRDSSGLDLGNKLITKEYLMSVYPQIAGQLITPELWVWGANGNAQFLGVNDINIRSVPVTTFAGGADWKQVACSPSLNNGHTAVIKINGTLWTWGFNGQGQLGNNTTTQRPTPSTTFAGGNNWKQVSCGSEHTSAIKTDGTLWTWGLNSYGELGINIAGLNTNGRTTPVTTFAGGTNWKQVFCGSQHTAAIKTDGTLWVWGRNSYGQLGNNTTTNRSTPVTTFAGGTNWKQVAAGGFHTAAIKTDGTLWTWGRNHQGQLGDNTTTQRNTPVTTFAGGTNWKQVSSARIHSAAIKTDGTLWAWGFNGNGQLGDNTVTQRLTPITTFSGGTNWKQVFCGYGHIATIKTDGTLWIWGFNNTGQLGTNIVGGTTNRSTPVTTFSGGTNWKQVACGYRYTAAIRTSDDLQGI